MIAKASYKSVCVFILIFILTLTVQAVRQGWSEPLLCLELFLIVAGLITAVFLKSLSASWHFSLTDGLMLAWFVYVVLNAYFKPEYPCGREVCTYSSLFALYILLRLFSGYKSFPFFCVLLLEIAVVYEIILGGWQLVDGRSHHVLYPVTGSFFNPGPYSAYISMGMVMALWQVYLDDESMKYHRIMKLLWGFVLAGGGVMLVLTGSRTAMLVVALMFLWLYRKSLVKYKWFVLLLGGLVFLCLFWVKKDSAIGRVVLWSQSLQLCFHSGWMGAGLGSFRSEYAHQLQMFFKDDYAVENYAQYADVTDYAFCDFLQLVIEQGWIGGTLCFLVMAFTLMGLYAVQRKLFFALVALLIFSLFSYPFQLLPFQLLAICFIACGSQKGEGLKMPLMMRCLVLLVIASLSCFCFVTTRRHIEAQNEYQEIAGARYSSLIKDYDKLLLMCEDNPRFLFDFAKLLQDDGAYLDSNDMLRRGLKVSNDPMFLVLMGNNFSSMGLYAEALRSYDVAFMQMPNRLYPLYKKMLLYERMHNHEKTLQMAKRIVAFVPKVSSPATAQMKSEAAYRIRIFAP